MNFKVIRIACSEKSRLFCVTTETADKKME
jgi:hypothetical protein